MAVDRYITLEDYQDDIVTYFDAYLANANLSQQIRYRVLGDEKLKSIIDVKINQPHVKFDTGIDVYFSVNHMVFEKLESKDKIMLLDEKLCGLYLDPKSETLKNSKNVLGARTSQKYGTDNLLRAKELAEQIFEQQKDQNKNK